MAKSTELILNSMSIGLMNISLQGKLLYINDACKELIGIEEKNIENIDIFKYIKELENVINNKNNMCYIDEHMILSTSNKKLSCDITSLVEGNRLTGYIILLKDMKKILNIANDYSSKDAPYTFDNIIGESPQIKKVIEQCIQIAKSPSTVLILGESGCGKELLAQSIHNASDFKFGPFIALNCGAIPKHLIESELFGYESGSFTGAKKGGTKGKFEIANNGTIFLDEIGEMPLDMQVILLRVLQEGYITRIGGKEQIPVNVRVIAATNKDLKEEVKKGNFRSDLYYRLNVLPIKIPPLKDRIGDVPLLINYFLDVKSKKLGKSIPKINQKLYRKMISFCWPGNIRELENCVENIVALDGITTYEIDFDECHCMTHDNLGNEINPYTNEVIDEVFDRKPCDEGCVTPLIELEKKEIKKAILLCKGNMTKVAQSLGISRNALYNKVKRYDINIEN